MSPYGVTRAQCVDNLQANPVSIMIEADEYPEITDFTRFHEKTSTYLVAALPFSRSSDELHPEKQKLS